MALKSYNLEGERRAGQTLVGNWQEERGWQDNLGAVKRTGHGTDLTAQPGWADEVYDSTTHATYRPPDPHPRQPPPRQAVRQRESLRSLTREIRDEAAATEDQPMYFTRGRFLHEPQLHEDLDLSYLTDEPITMHSEGRHNFGRDSHFSQPIQDYLGHRIVKDD
jgi:hypothetical protein